MTILLKPHQGGRPIILDKPILLIGRHPDCDVILKNSGKISRKHCCVALVDNRFVVRDLDSMNGVFVNRERVSHTAGLSIGDELMIGDQPFTLTKHKEKEVARKRPEPQQADATLAEIDPDEIPQSDSFEPDPAAVRAASAALKQRADPAKAGPSEGVEFSSAFAIPLPEDSDEDYVIPIADFDE
ncbi:MAG: putative component of type VI protein secretion system [Porticoccaceae bacterium]|jgi:predicted component of type VI protein secretion system